MRNSISSRQSLFRPIELAKLAQLKLAQQQRQQLDDETRWPPVAGALKRQPLCFCWRCVALLLALERRQESQALEGVALGSASASGRQRSWSSLTALTGSTWAWANLFAALASQYRKLDTQTDRHTERVREAAEAATAATTTTHRASSSLLLLLAAAASLRTRRQLIQTHTSRPLACLLRA